MNAKPEQSLSVDQVVADFELLDDWEDRYRYVIELGRELPPLPEAERTEANKVRGCASQVWLSTHENAEALFAQLDLRSHLTTQRSNGLRALVDRIKADADAALAASRA
jgi:cysteine desulfuration protein SufE